MEKEGRARIKKVSTERPLAEFTLRKYEKPFGLEGRELTRKACLSLGLLQPGDSRDGIVDVLHVLLHTKDPLPLEELTSKVIESRKTASVSLASVAPSNMRRHLRRLNALYLVERSSDGYRIHEGETLQRLFEDKIEQFVLKSTTQRVKEYMMAIDAVRHG